MHDFFNVIGVPESARAVDVRRLTARYVRRCHPDFRPAQSEHLPLPAGAPRDAAIDFIEPSALLDRMERAFFASPESTD